MGQGAIYGLDSSGDWLGAARESVVRALASDREKLDRSKTWGDVRVAELSEYNPWDWRPNRESWYPDGLEEKLAEHDDGERFDPYWDTVYVDDQLGAGNWPPLATNLIFTIVPERDPRWPEIIKRLDAVKDDDYMTGVFIRPDKAQELEAFLIEIGFAVTRDDALITKVTMEVG